TRSQAVELLAAERADTDRVLADNRRCLARITELEADAGGYRSVIEHLTQRAEKAEADNAAQAARIKELETERDEALDDAKFAERIATKREIDANANVEALEAKLAAAKDLISRAQEIIPDSYINWHDFARAVLGGKPS
ncbi:hypothetical protein, partial [Brucella sp. 22210]|uniref:hypothetical protein n=1 Tax=Brucella sp. 22210 TaxID=3453892 RepID=UPI003F872C46